MTMGEHQELDTIVDVKLDIADLEGAIDTLDGDPLFSEIADIFKELADGLNKGAEEGAKELAERVRSLQELFIAMNNSIHSRRLIGSIDVEGGGTEYTIGTNISELYPLAVELGRKEVTPVNKKALRWVTLSGAVVFSKYSGPTNPAPFSQPAYEQGLDEAEEIIGGAIDNVIN